MFITPFNIVGLFLLATPVLKWRQRARPRLMAPRVTDRRRNTESYIMNEFGPFATFLGVFLITSFLGIFVVVFPSGFHPPLAKVAFVWGTAFAISMIAAVVVWSRIKAGRYDLVIDHDSRTITIPAMHKRRAREMLPISEITTITTHEVRSGSGDDEKVRWHVTLRTRDEREILLREATLQEDVERLAETLKSRLHLE